MISTRLSFSKVKSAQNADHYFMETDNYYLKSDDFADRFQWWGKGARNLGLTGKVVGEDFLNVLEGKLPNGEQIASGVNGKRRPGFDLTFSAPKSVSILALVYGKHELLEAHQEAVKKVLEVIEEEAAQARITGKNGTEIELTRNLVAALFLHDTSRELEPLVHTHSVLANVTERSDGKWRALASNCNKTGSLSKGFYEYVYENQIYLSTIYRSSLAEILTNRFHYELEILPEHEGGKHGMFEIKGFPPELKKAFSTRREQIKKLMDEAEGNATSAKARDIFTLNSRKKKEAIDRVVLHERWLKKVKELRPDFDPDSLVKRPQAEMSLEPESLPHDAGKPALESERPFPDHSVSPDRNQGESGNTDKSALGKEGKNPVSVPGSPQSKKPGVKPVHSEEEASPSARQSVKPKDNTGKSADSPLQDAEPAATIKPATQVPEINPLAREAVIEATRHFAEARLVFTYRDLATKAMQFAMGKASFEHINTAIKQLRKENFLVSMSATHMSSQDILILEKSLLTRAESAMQSGVAATVNDRVLKKMAISTHQQEIVHSLLESTAGMSVVNVDLHSQPEAFIEALLNTAEHSGRRVKVLAPTKLYTNELGQKVQRRSFSAWHWVMRVFNKPEVAETVKGYLYRNQEPEGLSGFFNKAGRDVLVVDSAHRLGNQDLEGLLKVIESKKAKVILLNTEGALKGAAAGTPIELLRRAGIKEYKLAQEKTEQAQTAIIEIIDDKVRAEKIASKYAGFDETLQRDTHVLAHTHKQTDLLNQEIRRALKNTGQLSHNEYTISTLSPVYLGCE